LIKTSITQITKQISLEGEVVQEYTYFVLGFVTADIVNLKNGIWFSRLSIEQTKSIENFIEKDKTTQINKLSEYITV
jgi:hypothetical protein